MKVLITALLAVLLSGCEHLQLAGAFAEGYNRGHNGNGTVMRVYDLRSPGQSMYSIRQYGSGRYWVY